MAHLCERILSSPRTHSLSKHGLHIVNLPKVDGHTTHRAVPGKDIRIVEEHVQHGVADGSQEDGHGVGKSNT